MKCRYFSIPSFLFLFILSPGSFAQTTINTTVGSTGYTGTNSASNFITFVIENNSGGGILLTAVGNWTSSAYNGTTSALWYSSTSLSGSAGTIANPTWTQIASNVVSGISSSTLGVNNVITGMSFLIPNNTQYRFALTTTGTNRYSGTNTSFPTPNNFTVSGVTLKVGNFQISGSNVGYAGGNSPRAFTGSITFVSACNPVTGLAVGNVTNNSATLSWNAVSGSQGYEYVVNQSATPPTGAGTAVSGTSQNVGSLTSGTNYYAHVRNKCSSTSFSSWVTVPFSTLMSCFAPTNVGATNLTSSTGTLTWTPASISQGYEYKIDQTATAPTSGWNTTMSTSAPFTGLTGGASYYAHVRNVCDAADKSSWVNYPFTMPTCDAPVNILMGNIKDTSADVLWSQMPNAAYYEYIADFSNLTPTNTSGFSSTSGIAAELRPLSPNSKYYFHVRSRCFSVDSSDWRLDSFVTKMACYPPIVQVNNLGSNTPDAYWDPVPTAIAYEYALTHSAAVPAFGDEIYTTNKSLVLPVDGQDYYLHVRTKCNSMFTFSPWSTVVLRDNTTGVRAVQDDGAIEVFPNPLSDVLYISGAKGAAYRMSDITGRVVLQGVVSENKSGVNTSQLPGGIYLLEVGEQGAGRKFKVTK